MIYIWFFVALHYLDDSIVFPDANTALEDPNGLLALGGDLSCKRLLAAYRQGIFPWFAKDEPILWWSPNPRAVLDPLQFYVNRTFKRFLAKCNYSVTLNQDFLAVIRGCANHHNDTWITDDMINAYYQLHQIGFAHSIEIWQNSDLIGGVYGVAQGSLFCGESMFSLQTNASKVGLYVFCQHFMSCGGQLIDCQVLNDHTASLGAFNIARKDYLTSLKQLQAKKISEHCYLKQNLI